jgi:hypothetical protein
MELEAWLTARRALGLIAIENGYNSWRAFMATNSETYQRVPVSEVSPFFYDEFLGDATVLAAATTHKGALLWLAVEVAEGQREVKVYYEPIGRMLSEEEGPVIATCPDEVIDAAWPDHALFRGRTACTGGSVSAGCRSACPRLSALSD